MLYLVELERELELQPRFFGPRLREVLEQKLIAEACLYTTQACKLTPCSSSEVMHSLACLQAYGCDRRSKERAVASMGL
jgi:hypothetical protein